VYRTNDFGDGIVRYGDERDYVVMLSSSPRLRVRVVIGGQAITRRRAGYASGDPAIRRGPRCAPAPGAARAASDSA
jgi:hypothetical protein